MFSLVGRAYKAGKKPKKVKSGSMPPKISIIKQK
jgi:hypothetical protein